MHQWGRHGRCLSTSSFDLSCETDAWRTEHRLHCGQSETQILASCDDVGTFDAQSPYLAQRETDGVGIAGAQRLGGIGWPSVWTSHTGRDESHGYESQWDTVVRELFWDTSCVDPVRHVATITSSSITCTECIGKTGETRQFMSVKALLCPKRTKHGFRNPMRFFADDDGVCGACGTNFRTRLRLLDREELTVETCVMVGR